MLRRHREVWVGIELSPKATVERRMSSRVSATKEKDESAWVSAGRARCWQQDAAIVFANAYIAPRGDDVESR